MMCEGASRVSSGRLGLHDRGWRVVLGILLEERSSTDRSRRGVCWTLTTAWQFCIELAALATQESEDT